MKAHIPILVLVCLLFCQVSGTLAQVKKSSTIQSHHDPEEIKQTLCIKDVICMVNKNKCPLTLNEETDYFPFPSGSDKSEQACPFPAPFMKLDENRHCCFELTNPHVWPRACSTVPETETIDQFCFDFSSTDSRFQVRIERDMKFHVRPSATSSMHDSSTVSMDISADAMKTLFDPRRKFLVPPGGLGVGLPDSYSREELVKAPRVSVLGYTGILLLGAFLYAALLDMAAEQALIIEGKLREREFGRAAVSSADASDFLERGTSAADAPDADDIEAILSGTN